MTDKNIDFNSLTKKLSDPSDEVREEAAASLVGVTDKRLVPLLLKTLENDENPGVKYFMKKSLALIQKEHGDLKKILSELSAAKNSAAAAGEGGAGRESENQAAPDVSNAPQVKPEDMQQDTREAVDTILRRIREKDASLVNEAFEQLAEEEDPFIKATYISAVGRLGDQSNTEAILVFLSDYDFRVIANTVEALERLGNPKCVEELIKLISHPDNRVRANVIKALWKFTDSNMSINRHVVEKLRQMSESDNIEMCESALYVLSEIADEESIDILDKAAFSDNIELSAKASVMLEKAKNTYAERNSKKTEEKYINGVIEKLSRGESDSSKGIDEATRARIDLIQSYIDAGDKKMLPQVLKALAVEKNTFIRATLISAVGRLGGRGDLDALLPFVKDPDARVVANVVQALETIGNPKCVEHIVKLVAHPDNRVRANTVKAIWKYAHTNVTANRIVLERLKEMMFSTKNQMRESAIFVLSEIGDEEAIDLLSIAANDKNPEIKAKAEAALNNALKLKAERDFESSGQPVSEEEISRIPSLSAGGPEAGAAVDEEAEEASGAVDEEIQAKPVKENFIKNKPVEAGAIIKEGEDRRAEKITEKTKPSAAAPAVETPSETLFDKETSKQPERTAEISSALSEGDSGGAAEPAKIIDEATRKEIDRIQKLIDENDSSSLDQLIKRLAAEKNTFIKATLISAVGRLGGRENMEEVIGFLKDEDMRVVANTAEALENLGNAKCIEELIKYINHGDNRVRANVVKAVWKYAQSNMSASRVILARLKTMMFSTKAQMRESALYVLGEIASDDALELISIAVSDKVESVQQKAKEALERAEAKRREKPAAELKLQAAKQQSTPAADAKIRQASSPAKTSQSKQQTAASSQPGAASSKQNIKQDQPVLARTGAPVRRISLFRLLFIMMFLFTLSIVSGFSIYWFVVEGKDYQQLVTLVKSITQPAETAGDSASTPAGPAAASGTAEEGPAAPPQPAPAPSFTINDQVDQAKQYLNEGHFSESINSLSRLIVKNPQNADLKKVLLDSYFKRGQSLFNLEIFEAAKSDFDKITDLDKGGGYSQKAQSYIDKISKYIKK
jgi:HEAT repeat protein